jgi:hypothetical protein
MVKQSPILIKTIAATKDINQASARFKKSTVGTFNEQFKAYAS